MNNLSNFEIFGVFANFDISAFCRIFQVHNRVRQNFVHMYGAESGFDDVDKGGLQQ